MLTVNIHEAKTNLSKLIAAAVAGEPFVIAKAGKPLVTVTRIEEMAAEPRKRQLGLLRANLRSRTISITILGVRVAHRREVYR